MGYDIYTELAILCRNNNYCQLTVYCGGRTLQCCRFVVNLENLKIKRHHHASASRPSSGSYNSLPGGQWDILSKNGIMENLCYHLKAYTKCICC